MDRAGCCLICGRAQSRGHHFHLCTCQNGLLRRRRQVRLLCLPSGTLTHPPLSWGRILAALGRVPLSAPIDPTRVSVSFLPSDGTAALPLLVHGEPRPVDEARAKVIIQEEDVEVSIELGMGKAEAQYWTCDFSHVSASRLFPACLVNAPCEQEYVTINGSYRS